MKRKPGTLLPLETSILQAAADLMNAGTEEFHGYQLAKHLAAAADQRLLTAHGTLYRALGRLEEMGLLASHWEDPQIAADENRPVRRLYSLTALGAGAVEQPARRLARKARSSRHRKVSPA